MRFLFYLVHPAKFQFHKIQINKLKEHGHTVDIVINTKDILEDLVLEEGWEYKNIFPNSRKIKGVHVYVAAAISLLLSIYRLWKFSRNKKYDLFIGDALTYLGRLKRIPSLYPTDDVLAAVPEQRTWFIPANYIIAPKVTDVGKYENKKIAYHGYKALAHLHPNHFAPDRNILSNELQNGSPFFLIRCTGFMATHDLNKSGISDDVLFRLIDILEPHGKVLISSERKLPARLEKYRLNVRKNDITHYIALASLFIGDSTTMSTEAAVLGTPSIEFDEYFYEIEQMIELEQKYGLIHCFRTDQEEEFLKKVSELVRIKNVKAKYESSRRRLLSDTIDVSGFLIWLFENYPHSIEQYMANPDIQYSFR
jgi:uncharacterized protein